MSEAHSSIPTASKLVERLGSADAHAGDLAISALEEFYRAYRGILEEGVEEEPYLHGYLQAYDHITQQEIRFFRDMGPHDKAEFGRLLCDSGFVHELAAYSELLESTDPRAKEKKKKGGQALQEELKELKKLKPGWIPIPNWLETVLKSIVDIFS